MRLSENDEVVKTCLHMFRDCITVYTKQNLLKIINYAYEAGKRDKTEKKNIDSTSTGFVDNFIHHGGAIKHERKNN
jgi:hypothetical protein